MNSADLAAKLADEYKLTRADARKLVDGLFTAIADTTAAGREVTIQGFGKFRIVPVAPRVGRNPRTGKPMAIPASRKPAFVAAKQFKDKARV